MLVWNVMGCINFIAQMNPDMVASYRETEQAIISGRPIWATVAFGVGVFGGALGCGLLLFKRSVSVYLLEGSFLGIVLTMIYTLSLDLEFSLAEIIGIIMMPLVVALYLIWYSIHVRNKGWFIT